MTSHFQWSDKRTKAALALADGKTQTDVARETGITRRTLYQWLQESEFSAEVDRLSLMTSIAGRAERLRIAKRLVAQRVKDDALIHSDRDLLDWLKYAQGETDGIKLELTHLAAVCETETPVAARRQD